MLSAVKGTVDDLRAILAMFLISIAMRIHLEAVVDFSVDTTKTILNRQSGDAK